MQKRIGPEGGFIRVEWARLPTLARSMKCYGFIPCIVGLRSEVLDVKAGGSGKRRPFRGNVTPITRVQTAQVGWHSNSPPLVIDASPRTDPPSPYFTDYAAQHHHKPSCRARRHKTDRKSALWRALPRRRTLLLVPYLLVHQAITMGTSTICLHLASFPTDSRQRERDNYNL